MFPLFVRVALISAVVVLFQACQVIERKSPGHYQHASHFDARATGPVLKVEREEPGMETDWYLLAQILAERNAMLLGDNEIAVDGSP